ncbi:acyloxyacyl hydrolase [Geomonas sp.]|uniref:acyloxyacyl hydrolase n=1 Tax=Geomonas sp. TaxID=2651584 RepID=UPI002B478F6F|nr:acyloxyacyl hydrolase [Geomonas sp.]
MPVLYSEASAEEFPPFPAATKEYSFLLGYGSSIPGFGTTKTRVETVDFTGRFGYFISDEVGSGWYRGQFEMDFELPLNLATAPKLGFMTGGNVLQKYNFNGLKEKRLIPYVFGGGGVVYVDLNLPTMGSKLDFSYGGGAGLQYLYRKDLALSFESRYHHISNANTAEPNEPLNSVKVLLGVSLFR